jgi:hypothetical protein
VESYWTHRSSRPCDSRNIIFYAKKLKKEKKNVKFKMQLDIYTYIQYIGASEAITRTGALAYGI